MSICRIVSRSGRGPTFTFQAEDGRRYEVDLLAATPTELFPVEIKSQPNRIDGDTGTWVWNMLRGQASQHAGSRTLVRAGTDSPCDRGHPTRRGGDRPHITVEDLALSVVEAGYVGMITSDSFMKRETRRPQ